MAVIDRKFDRKILIMRSRSRSRFFQFIAIAVAISEKWPRSWSRDQTIAIVTNLFKPQETNLDPPESSESALKFT